MGYHSCRIETLPDILQCRRGGEQDQGVLQGVNSLEIGFLLRGKHCNHIDNWISSTITSITKQLILVFDMPMDRPPAWNLSNAKLYEESELYEFPFEILLNLKNSSLEYLQLEYISIKLPLNLDCFATLRTLKLSQNNLTQGNVHRLLINCPLLEFLKIQECEDLVALQVSSPLPHLKTLIQKDCGPVTSIELCAENLSNLDYDSAADMDHLMLRGCQKLTKVVVRDIYYTEDFRPLSNDFPFVTTLFVISSLEVMDGILRDNIFGRLKILSIFSDYIDSYNGVHFPSFLSEVAPMLEEFELHVTEKVLKSYKRFVFYGGRGPFHHLKRVAFTGFRGEIGEMKLATYFLRKASHLRIMTIDPLRKYYPEFDVIEEETCKRLIDDK